MAKTADYLWQRGHQYHLRLGIPRTLRQHFLSSTGKPQAMIVEPLGDSHEAARRESFRRVAVYQGIFADLRAGKTVTRQEIKARVSLDIEAANAELRAVTTQAWRQEVATMDLEEVEAAIWKIEHFRNPEAQRLRDLIERRAVLTGAPVLAAPVEPAAGQTLSEAADAMYAAMERDGRRPNSIADRKRQVAKFIAAVGNVPLIEVTRAMVYDFLETIRDGGTRNNYASAISQVFDVARKSGRFTRESPAVDQHVEKNKEKARDPFTVEQLQRMFDARPIDIAPVQHSCDTALPLIIRIAAFTGMRLEEICQLKAGDVRTEGTNGGSVLVFDVHDKGDNNIKNYGSVRKVPVASALVRAGLMQYKQALPQGGLLFPGLTRRASNGGKFYALTSKKFRELLKEIGIKTDRLDFHSFRHTVEQNLRSQGDISQNDIDDVVGHTSKSIGRRVYSVAELSTMKRTVERINYEGLRV